MGYTKYLILAQTQSCSEPAGRTTFKGRAHAMLHGWRQNILFFRNFQNIENFQKKTQKVEILKISEKKLKNIEN